MEFKTGLAKNCRLIVYVFNISEKSIFSFLVVSFCKVVRFDLNYQFFIFLVTSFFPENFLLSVNSIASLFLKWALSL